MKKKMWVIMFIIVLIGVIILYSNSLKKEPVIGGQRDEHGCLGPAGYSFNETLGACLREWELNDDQRKAGKIATEYFGKEKMTIVEVLAKDCIGCYEIKLTSEDFSFESVSLNNWEVQGEL